MQISRLRIVALPYYEAATCLEEFYGEALGRAMTLRPEPTNERDVNAICAYDWQGRHVGYVTQDGQPLAFQALWGSGRRSLRGRVCEVSAAHKYVVFECSVETLGAAEDLYPQAPYLDWTYCGPVLKPTQVMVTLDYMMDEICERLAERDSWTEAERTDFVALTTRFCGLSKFDLSGEMSDFRRRLCLQLMQTEDEVLLPLVQELKMACGRAGRETHSGEVLDHWMQVLSEATMVQPLLVHRQEYDLERIREQLEAFPDAMYQEWLENRERFVAKLLYKHIPREVLWRLVSGIAFYEAATARDRARGETAAPSEGAAAESPVFLSQLKGQKIDAIRVLNVMYEQGRFTGRDGQKLTKKEFFTAMGQALHVDLSDYDKDLSRSLSDSTRLDKHLRVFKEMEQKMEEIWNSK